MTTTLDQVFDRAPADLPVGALRDAWQALGPTASASDVIVTAGRLRERHVTAEQRTAVPRERRVSSPSARAHGRVLATALDPTVRYVRREVFGEESVPFRSAKSSVKRLESDPKVRDRLEPLVRRLAAATGFELADCYRWVLIGRPPRPPVKVTLYPRVSQLPDGRWIDSTRVLIESAVPLTGDPEIREATRIARKLWGTDRMKAWSDEDVRLIQEIAKAGGAPQGDGMLNRWEEVAERAGLVSGPAALQRWMRIETKAEQFGIPLDPAQARWPRTWKRWAQTMAETKRGEKD